MDKNKKYRKNLCQCGNEKDKRAKLCLKCRFALNINLKPNKNCRGCGKSHLIDEYEFRISNGKKTRQSRCKKCRAEYSKQQAILFPEKIKERSRQYAKKRPDRVKMWAMRSRWKRWGHNPDEVEKFIIDHREKGCRICGLLDKLVVDHNHSTGRLRGMLCSECNFGLGKFKDSKELLLKAFKYLESENI